MGILSLLGLSKKDQNKEDKPQVGIPIREFKAKPPEKGDKIILLDAFFSSITDDLEVSRLAKLNEVTVDSAIGIILGSEGNYWQDYEISIVESKYIVSIYGVHWLYKN